MFIAETSSIYWVVEGSIYEEASTEQGISVTSNDSSSGVANISHHHILGTFENDNVSIQCGLPQTTDNILKSKVAYLTVLGKFLAELEG